MAATPDLPELPFVDHLEQASMRARVQVGMGSVPAELKADRRFLWAYVHLTRVADKAIREYNSARDDSQTFETLSVGRTSYTVEEASAMTPYLIWALDHLESCLDATHRAVEAAKLLRAEGIGAQAPQPNTDSVKRLNNIRDAVQHTPERLIGTDLRRPDRRPFGPEDPYGISARKHDLVIGAEDPLTYVELIKLIETCYRTAEFIGGR